MTHCVWKLGGYSLPPFTPSTWGGVDFQQKWLRVILQFLQCVKPLYYSGVVRVTNSMLEMNIQTRGSYFLISGPNNLGFGRWGTKLHYNDGVNSNVVCSAISYALWDCVAEHSRGMSKQSVGIVLRRQVCLGVHLGELRWGKFQKRFWKWSVVNTCWLQQSTSNLRL